MSALPNGAWLTTEGGIALTPPAASVVALAIAAAIVDDPAAFEWDHWPGLAESTADIIADEISTAHDILRAKALSLAEQHGLDVDALMDAIQ